MRRPAPSLSRPDGGWSCRIEITCPTGSSRTNHLLGPMSALFLYCSLKMAPLGGCHWNARRVAGGHYAIEAPTVAQSISVQSHWVCSVDLRLVLAECVGTRFNIAAYVKDGFKWLGIIRQQTIFRQSDGLVPRRYVRCRAGWMPNQEMCDELLTVQICNFIGYLPAFRCRHSGP